MTHHYMPNKKSHVNKKLPCQQESHYQKYMFKKFPWPKLHAEQKFHVQHKNTNPYLKNFPLPLNKTYTFQQKFCIQQKWICSTKPIKQNFS